MSWGLGRWGIGAGATAIGLAVFLLGVGAGGAVARGESIRPVRQVRSVSIAAKAVALTFDDGPSPKYTPAILALLKEYGAKATFFVVGQELVRYPQVARQEYADGMELGNHGFRHLTLAGLDPTAVTAEVRPVEQEITAITGNRPVLYRLPKGRGDPRSLRTLADMGYTVVYWSIDTRDYLPRSPANIVSQVEKQAAPGAIVIFHDGGGNQQHTVGALGTLLPWFKEQGYQLVTVSQLLELAQTGAAEGAA